MRKNSPSPVKTARRPVPKITSSEPKRVKERTHVPTQREIDRAIQEAIDKRIYARSDAEIKRAIADDPDTFAADLRKLRAVMPGDVNVARIRSKFRLSQAEFGQRVGVSARVISDWEQYRKKPTAAARSLLILLDELGETALRALAKRVA